MSSRTWFSILSHLRILMVVSLPIHVISQFHVILFVPLGSYFLYNLSPFQKALAETYILKVFYQFPLGISVLDTVLRSLIIFNWPFSWPLGKVDLFPFFHMWISRAFIYFFLQHALSFFPMYFWHLFKLDNWIFVSAYHYSIPLVYLSIWGPRTCYFCYCWSTV